MVSVYFKESNLTIQFDDDNGSNLYYVDLERCTDSAEVLDYILQLPNKDWCTPQVLSDFVKALENACEQVFGKNAQEVFCPFGQNHGVDWKEKTSEPIDK